MVPMRRLRDSQTYLGHVTRQAIMEYPMKVELLDHMGDDLMVVNAARVSYAKHA